MSYTRRRVAIAESVVCAELDDEMVLLNVQTGNYFGLDAVGARIWSLLAEGADEEAVVSDLLSEFDVEEDRVRADVTGFIDTLMEQELVGAGG